MQPSAEVERRRSSRFEFSVKVTAQEIISSTSAARAPTNIRGQSRNVSHAGMCLALDRECAVSSVLRCDVFFPGSGVSIPTLARVQWIQHQSPAEFVAGVEFLL